MMFIVGVDVTSKQIKRIVMRFQNGKLKTPRFDGTDVSLEQNKSTGEYLITINIRGIRFVINVDNGFMILSDDTIKLVQEIDPIKEELLVFIFGESLFNDIKTRCLGMKGLS